MLRQHKYPESHRPPAYKLNTHCYCLWAAAQFEPDTKSVQSVGMEQGVTGGGGVREVVVKSLGHAGVGLDDPEVPSSSVILRFTQGRLFRLTTFTFKPD